MWERGSDMGLGRALPHGGPAHHRHPRDSAIRTPRTHLVPPSPPAGAPRHRDLRALTDRRRDRVRVHRRTGRLVAAPWERTVAHSLDDIQAEAQRRANQQPAGTLPAPTEPPKMASTRSARLAVQEYAAPPETSSFPSQTERPNRLCWSGRSSTLSVRAATRRPVSRRSGTLQPGAVSRPLGRRQAAGVREAEELTAEESLPVWTKLRSRRSSSLRFRSVG